jgi:hypothetical protein
VRGKIERPNTITLQKRAKSFQLNLFGQKERMERT